MTWSYHSGLDHTATTQSKSILEGNISLNSTKFGIVTLLGGTHLPSFLRVIFTKGERNLKCAHMRLKKPAALPSPCPSLEQNPKPKRRATMATIVGIRVLFKASHVG